MTMVDEPNVNTSPLKASAKRKTRKLCLCSKLEVLHYAHAPGEVPVPMSGGGDLDNSMDMDDDS
jgi:hypothetical protein